MNWTSNRKGAYEVGDSRNLIITRDVRILFTQLC